MWPTIIVLAVIIGLAALSVKSLIKQKKSGGCSGCADGCSSCPSAHKKSS